MKSETKRELIVVATMISRMMGTSVFSDQMGFSVATVGHDENFDHTSMDRRLSLVEGLESDNSEGRLEARGC